MRWFVWMLGIGLLASGCGSAELKPVTTPDPRILPQETDEVPDACPQHSEDTSGQAVTGSVTVLSSPLFREAMIELKAGFANEHPGVSVDLQVAETPALRDRLVGGEEAEVAAIDDTAIMQQVVDACRVSARTRVFARGEGGVPYEIAALQPPRNLPAAQRFVGYVISDKGQKILERHGFASVS